MTERYIRDVLKTVIAQICQTIGWHSIQSTSLEITVDVLHRYLFEIAKLTHRYSEQFGQTQPNLDHLGLAFRDMHININELEEYVQYVESVPCVYDVPKLPVPRESHLNFLKPGSQEVVTRPVYVHEHLPPMYPELEAEERNSVLPPVDGGTISNGIQNLPQSPEEPENVFKRPGDPISENSMAKRAKMSLGEEGRPTREISSVMMTSSGFLSPAREGKLPEARTPQNLSDCPTTSPLYPAVPPEVRMEKKIKKMLDIKKKECVNKELFKPDKNITISDDTKARKLANMKEVAKLKALKPGAVKMGFNNEPLNNCIMPNSLPYKLQSDQKLPKMNQVIPKIEDVTIEPPIQEHQITGKLSAEPDRLKLNIFKKISSKVKDEKVDKLDKVKTESVDHGFSREIAPGLFLTEISPVKHDKNQKDEKNRIINNSIKEEITCTQTVITKVNQPISPNIVKSPRSDKDYIHDVDLSPPNTPGTPSTPKTPELTINPPPRKVEKEKRKRKECARLKVKEPKTKTPKQVQRKMKAVKNFTEMARPKTPDGLVNFIKPPELLVPPNMFPIFQSFSGGPGLIPPPMGHPFLGLPFPPRGLPVGHGFGQPPTLAQRPVVPIPNPIQMRMPKPDPPPTVPPEPRIEPVIVTPAVEVKEEPPVIVQERPKPVEVIKEKSEKKSKEHKKEKKEKAKLRKKREKKDKIKSKDKAEKKREKVEKKEREKLTKVKKEKKEKHKEKEREQESVPKLTLKLGPSCVPSPDPTQMSRKITIKPVTKKSDDDKVTPITEPTREPSPELARISALVTRPPKPNKTATMSAFYPSTNPSQSQPPPELSIHTKLKKSIFKPIPKIKSKDLMKKVAEHMASSDGTALQHNPSISTTSVTPTVGPPPTVNAFYFDKDGNKVWICPACGSQDDGSPMIGCDDCDAWYHWVCVGIQVPPDDNEDWYCRVCIVKKQETLSTDKKKKRKKKDKKEH